jgi:ABC-type branched-subunit amino acid transport system substrate-binding protein
MMSLKAVSSKAMAVALLIGGAAFVPITTGVASASSKTINVFVTGTFSAPSGAASFPQSEAAIKAQFDAVNAAGGVGGHKVKAITCDDQGSPNAGATCAREAVSDHVVAVVEGFTDEAPSEAPIFEAAHIAVIPGSPNTPTDTAGSVYYAGSGGTLAEIAGAGEALAQAGCKEVVAVRLDVAATAPLATLFDDGAIAGGAKAGPTIVTGLNQPTFGPTVAAAQSSGADCLGAFVEPAQCLELLTAGVPVGIKYVGGSSGAFTQQEITQLGSSANNHIIIGSSFPPVTSNIAGMVKFRNTMKKYATKADASDTQALRSWFGGLIFTQVGSKISGAITAASFLHAISHAAAVNTDGITVPINFTHKSGISSAPALYNGTINAQVVKAGIFAPLNKKVISTDKIIKEAGA